MFPSKQKLIKSIFSLENVKKIEKAISKFFLFNADDAKRKTMVTAKRVRVLRLSFSSNSDDDGVGGNADNTNGNNDLRVW